MYQLKTSHVDAAVNTVWRMRGAGPAMVRLGMLPQGCVRRWDAPPRRDAGDVPPGHVARESVPCTLEGEEHPQRTQRPRTKSGGGLWRV